MKIRNDFVSNSSSSSFVLVGKVFDKDEVLEFIVNHKDKFLEKVKENNPKLLTIFGNDIKTLILSCGIYDMFREFNLDCKEDGESGDGYGILIGLDPCKMNGEQTLNDFKKLIAEYITQFGLDVRPDELDFVSGGTDPSGYTFFDSLG